MYYDNEIPLYCKGLNRRRRRPNGGMDTHKRDVKDQIKDGRQK